MTLMNLMMMGALVLNLGYSMRHQEFASKSWGITDTPLRPRTRLTMPRHHVSVTQQRNGLRLLKQGLVERA